MERRGKSEAPDTRGSVNEEATSNHQTSSLSELAYIDETIARGAITIGVVPPLKEMRRHRSRGKAHAGHAEASNRPHVVGFLYRGVHKAD